jgi:hypothetical protein
MCIVNDNNSQLQKHQGEDTTSGTCRWQFVGAGGLAEMKKPRSKSGAFELVPRRRLELPLGFPN